MAAIFFITRLSALLTLRPCLCIKGMLSRTPPESQKAGGLAGVPPNGCGSVIRSRRRRDHSMWIDLEFSGYGP